MDADPDRRTLVAVGLALAAVVALGVAAATLDTAVEPGSGGLPSGGGAPSEDADFGIDNRTDEQDPPDNDDFDLSAGSLPYCYPWLNSPTALGAIVGVFALGMGIAYVRTDSVLPPAAFLAAFGPPVFFAHTLLTRCTPGSGWAILASLLSDLRGPFVTGEGGAVGVGGAGVSAPTAALGIVLFVALLAAVFLLFIATGDETQAASGETSDDDDTDGDGVAAVARVAGEAAARIEADADADNEVFRAWAAMTDHLDVERPESSTPTEFALAAVDAGMADEDVRELTGLFESVRYGRAEATQDREERAVAALRRIETEYGEST